MIDFNNADIQKEVGSGNGPIPAKSFVKVRMTVRQPKAGQQSDQHQALSVSKKNNHYLDMEFEVLAGTYKGLKFWEIFVVVGSEKSCQISMSFLRAVLEAARGINPNDASQQATQARQLNDWFDFNGLEFPVMVKIETPKAGDRYLNNKTMRAVTPDKEEYQIVMPGGEIISDIPLPKIPEESAAGGGAAGGGGGQQETPKWGQQKTTEEPPPLGQQKLPGVDAGQASGQPSWATGAKG